MTGAMQRASQSSSVKRVQPKNQLLYATRILIVIAISVGAFELGVRLRREEWFRTSPVRFESDVFNGFRWGRAANRPDVGIFNVYDLDSTGRIPGVRPIDYTPLRLMVVYLWAKWAAVHYPEVTAWHNDYEHVYELTLPMLRANLVCELASSILVFFLIRMWIIRMDDAALPADAPRKALRGVPQGMAGALLFWFNPAVIRSAQTYPQWDVWNMPFFLGTVLLACADWWFAAGFCLVVGTFLKGQILLVAPIFLLWPIFLLRFDALFKFITGFLAGAALIALPWLLASPAAITWFLLLMLATSLMAAFTLRWRIGWRWIVALSIAALLIAWPWGSKAPIPSRLLAPALLGVLTLCRFLPARLLPHVQAFVAAVAVFLMIPLYGASMTWFTAGFEYSTQRIMMTAVPGTYNLPSLLVTAYDWPNDPNFTVRLPLIGQQIVFRHLMLLVYTGCLVVCSAGAALHIRRNDTRFLVAIITPWLCFFTLLTQMNNRYIMWAAGFSALLAGVDLGMALLGCIVTAISYTAIASVMNLHLSLGTPEDIEKFSAVTPHLAWALLLAMAIYLYIAITPRRLPAKAALID